MTDERIELIGSVRLGIMDGTAALARLGESAS